MIFFYRQINFWFIQVKAQFALKGVTVSSTKFNYCVSSFNQETDNQVLDLIKSPPATQPYEEPVVKAVRPWWFPEVWGISNLPLSGDIETHVKHPCPAPNQSQTLPFPPWSLSQVVAHRCSSSPAQGRFLRPYFSRPQSRWFIPKQSFFFSCVHHLRRPRGAAISQCCEMLVLTAPAILLRLMPAAARKTVPSLLPCVIIIVPGGLRLRSVEPLVPGWENSSPAGGCSYPSCRIFYLLSTGFPEFKEIFNWLWCVCIRVPCSEVLVQLFRSTATDCGWFFSLMLGFWNNSSMFWEPQVRVAFSVSSSGHSYLWSRLFETL